MRHETNALTLHLFTVPRCTCIKSDTAAKYTPAMLQYQDRLEAAFIPSVLGDFTCAFTG